MDDFRLVVFIAVGLMLICCCSAVPYRLSELMGGWFG